jgi:hypothetical protein
MKFIKNELGEVIEVTMSPDEYEELFNDSVLLNACRNAGIDNWDGWEFALEEYHNVIGNDDEE